MADLQRLPHRLLTDSFCLQLLTVFVICPYQIFLIQNHRVGRVKELDFLLRRGGFEAIEKGMPQG